MKKILLSSIILFLFSVSIVLFQISCKKEAVADVAVRGSGGKILFTKIFRGTVPETQELWCVNQDGSDSKKININFQAGFTFDPKEVHISQNGKKIFLHIRNESNEIQGIYMCPIDGGDLTQLLEFNKTTDICLNATY